jgi:DNA-binding GntR family transcriptional regulator
VSVNAEERAYRSIINLILSGTCKPGDFLLELDLTARLGMSRTPVSRALGRLVAEGFLGKMPKKGCFIPLPTPEDAEQVFLARRAVESSAAAAAATRGADEEFRSLEELLEGDERALLSGEKEAFSDINERFHMGIARASHNAYLEKWCRNIFWRSNVYVFYFDSFYKPSEIQIVHKTPMQHAAILRALLARDADAAARLMDEHIRRTYEVLLLTR